MTVSVARHATQLPSLQEVLPEFLLTPRSSLSISSSPSVPGSARSSFASSFDHDSSLKQHHGSGLSYPPPPHLSLHHLSPHYIPHDHALPYSLAKSHSVSSVSSSGSAGSVSPITHHALPASHSSADGAAQPRSILYVPQDHVQFSADDYHRQHLESYRFKSAPYSPPSSYYAPVPYPPDAYVPASSYGSQQPLPRQPSTAVSGTSDSSLHVRKVSDGSVDDSHHVRASNISKKRRGNLPKHVTDILRTWLNGHVHHPYPTEDEKAMLMRQTGLTMNQISNWFINARRRRLPNMHKESSSTKR
ncbi:homeobox KN domain-containing protein [Lipomyces japonicus]|uniref:homeobox KN domain-containing protein n=1 Tax=Lipomyces japonicus TaxID=56871 RepID=UPI0034CFDA0F